jgi:hypothetical protein
LDYEFNIKVIQFYHAFLAFILEEESQEVNKNQPKTSITEIAAGVACFNEVIPILQFICSRMEEAQT